MNLAVASVLLLLPWAVAFEKVRHHHLDSGAVSLAATFSLGLPALWLAVAGYLETRRPEKASELTMAQVADQLAIGVGAQWEAEARVHRLNVPYPLPVSWTAADPSLTDSWDSLLKLATSGAGWPPPPPAGTWAAGPWELAGEAGELANVLARVPTGRLVVLGEPGSGKTMLMVRLVLDMLARRGEGGPIPILTSVASWNPATQDLQDWLSTQLLMDHPALADPPPAEREEPTLVAALLANGLILPILDGLDEIPAEARGSVITRINDMLRPGQQLVLTCRSKEYRDAVRPEGGVEVTLRAAAAVQLCFLDADAVRHYLCDDAGGPVAMARWDPVLAMLGTEAPVGQALRTPLMVSLARAIYNPRPGELAGAVPNPEELCKPSLADREAVESRLFDVFIPAAYRHATAGRWKLRQAEASLMFLASHLETIVGEPNLAWWQLRSDGALTVLRLVAGLVAGLTVSLVVGLVVGIMVGIMVGLVVGLMAGLVAGVAVGFLVGVAARSDSAGTPARGVQISWKGLGLGLGFGLGAGVMVGLGLFNVVGLVFIYIFGYPMRYPAGLVVGIVAGLAYGFGAVLTFGIVGVPSDLSAVTSPRAVLARDRQLALLFMLAGGLMGGLVSAFATPFVAGPGRQAATPLAIELGFGVCLGSVAGLGLSMFKTAWPSYTLARGALAFFALLPWSLMGFLEDAHRRGVLRQAGAVYQFRHIELQHRLASTSGMIGFYYDVQDVDGGKYRVTLKKVIDPARSAGQDITPDNGMRFVGAVFTITGLDGSPHGEDVNRYAAAIGSDGQVYSADINGIAGYTGLDNGSIHVAQDETVTGPVIFQVPDGIEVLKIQWAASGSSSTVQWRNVRR